MDRGLEHLGEEAEKVEGVGIGDDDKDGSRPEARWYWRTGDQDGRCLVGGNGRRSLDRSRAWRAVGVGGLETGEVWVLLGRVSEFGEEWVRWTMRKSLKKVDLED